MCCYGGALRVAPSVVAGTISRLLYRSTDALLLPLDLREMYQRQVGEQLRRALVVVFVVQRTN